MAASPHPRDVEDGVVLRILDDLLELLDDVGVRALVRVLRVLAVLVVAPPANQPNPSWLGDLQIFVSCPSAGVFNAPLGTRGLTGLAAGEFSTLTYDVPADVVAVLSGAHPDCALSFALNVNAGAGTWVLDNLGFAGP